MDAVPPSWRLMRLLDGFVTTQLPYVAAELGVAEVLADGPKSGVEIAAAVGVPAGPLVRVGRGRRRRRRPRRGRRRTVRPHAGAWLPALRGAAEARADLYYRGAAGLLDAVRAGGTAFEHVYGERFFEHLEHDADHQAGFEASMAGGRRGRPATSWPPTTSAGSGASSTWAGAGASCSPASSRPGPGYAACSSTVSR